MTDAVNASRGRKKFLLIAAIFFVPMILAWVVYFGPDSWYPSSTTNKGELISPAVPLELGPIVLNDRDEPEEPWAKKWTLLQLIPTACDASCVARVVDIRQLRTSLGRRRDRVQRLILVPNIEQAKALEAQFSAEHPHLRFGVLDPVRFSGLAEQINRDEPLTVAIVDPIGNYLMRYEPEVDLRGMYKDIMKLLKLSNIG